MYKLLWSSFFLILTTFSFAQTEADTLQMTQQDSSIIYSVELRELIIAPDGVYSSEDVRKARLILKRRIFKVYPYAKLAADKLTQLNSTMTKLKTNREKKKYFKIVEKYLEEEFEPRLKKLSRKDGQILVKLIYRQTGSSTYDLIKEYKSGWKAFWANSTAYLFDINLKTEYQPYAVTEDYHIEGILNVAFNQGQLTKQEAKKPIDFENLKEHWSNKTNSVTE
ncbi:DUF4294 domain-containing protein [Flavobacterium sp. HXWNR69]|uniref:DUF4294 domain-containing protein n=1 Tax=Flavobacterium fragile TaxID=2949085 RepID=A0ABT0TJK7_9FLAO|nr:DUF4294 domain-containing protein [Flavobacterium sp. HXWNR69]MCL9771164.1 DUF4294 domain-containing protein [Flavobacterium sp. HXWNR69]